MPLIKEPVFKSFQAAMTALSHLALAPGEDGEVNVEYTNYIEEHKFHEAGIEYDVVALWGNADVFFLRNGPEGELSFIDYVHHDDPSSHEELHLQLQQLLKRCMLVGYVPVNLLEAIRDRGRDGSYQYFLDKYKDLVDYVFEAVESFEEAC